MIKLVNEFFDTFAENKKDSLNNEKGNRRANYYLNGVRESRVTHKRSGSVDAGLGLGSDGNDSKEMREYVIELESYYETFAHAEGSIRVLEEQQGTLCPQQLPEETFSRLQSYFNELELFIS